MKATYLNLKFDEEIYPKFPQSVKAIIEWFCSREDITAGLMGMGGDVASKEEVILAMQQVVPVIIQHDPRKLYEFFDDQGIRIFIGGHPDNDEIFVHHNSKSNHSHSADSRIEAEEKAFLAAFTCLETELQAKKSKDEEGKGDAGKEDSGSK